MSAALSIHVVTRATEVVVTDEIYGDVPKPILGFFGDYRFLSNFAPPGFALRNLWFPTNEHFYQAAKCPEERVWFDKIRRASGPGAAKRLGRAAPVRDDWEEVKEAIMLQGLRLKFSDQHHENTHAKNQLLATGDAYLEETNTWGDTYWGVCQGLGENRLGVLLMQVREELRQ
jgi:ribA/ribD-fused uncharacterized protein